MKEQFSSPVASVTVDCAIFGFYEGVLKVLLIKRSSAPEAGAWALPGGFMELDENAEEAADRVLQLMTGIKGVYMEQTGFFSSVDRHPMGRVVSVGFVALVNPENFKLTSRGHASEAKWFDVDKRPNLPFDHEAIFTKSSDHLRREVKLKPLGFELLPQKFTMTELQVLYEVVGGEKYDRRNFRRKIKSMNLLTELDEKKAGAHLSATLYRFDKKVYARLSREGFMFQVK